MLRWDMEMFRALFPGEIANQMISRKSYKLTPRCYLQSLNHKPCIFKKFIHFSNRIIRVPWKLSNLI